MLAGGERRLLRAEGQVELFEDVQEIVLHGLAYIVVGEYPASGEFKQKSCHDPNRRPNYLKSMK